MRFPVTQKNVNEHVFSQAQLLVEERRCNINCSLVSLGRSFSSLFELGWKNREICNLTLVRKNVSGMKNTLNDNLGVILLLEKFSITRCDWFLHYDSRSRPFRFWTTRYRRFFFC